MKSTYAQRAVDLALKSGLCVMIGPAQEYNRDGDNFPPPKIEWKPSNKELLKNTISNVMKTNYKAELSDALLQVSPIIYADCAAKGEKTLLVYLLKVFIDRFAKDEKKDELLENAMLEHSYIKEDETLKEYRKNYAGNNFSHDFLQHHTALLKKSVDELEERKPGEGRRIIHLEQRNMREAIGDVMEHHNKAHAYMYLDGIHHLSSHEQTHIMDILFCRGALGGLSDARLYIKINNGGSERKTYRTSDNKRVETPHDYSDSSIKEKDLTAK